MSPFQGELGWHAPGDIEAHCDPIISRRFGVAAREIIHAYLTVPFWEVMRLIVLMKM